MKAIIGGTGTVGSEVVKQLAATGTRFRVLTRTPENALRAPNVDVVKGSASDPLVLAKLCAGADKLFLLLPSIPGSVELASSVLAAAKKAGVRHVVRLSVLGADPESKIQVVRWHAQTEANLKASGMAWTILRPSSFAQILLRSVPTIKSGGIFYGAWGLGKVCLVDARDVAAVAVKCLSASGHEGKVYTLTGQEPLTYVEIAARLTHALDRKILYANLTPEKLKQQLVSSGVPDWLAADYAALQLWASTGRAAVPDPTLPKLIGRVRKLDDFLDSYIQAFK